MLCDHENMFQWAPFKRSTVQRVGDGRGVGLVRRLSGGPLGMALTETIVAAEAPHRLEYQARGVPGQSRYHGYVSVEPADGGGSTITWQAQYRSVLPASAPITAAMLRTLVRGLAQRAESDRTLTTPQVRLDPDTEGAHP